MLDKSIGGDFPILKRKINDRRLIYLDNAATTQKPRQVIDAINKYYTEYNSNVHRGVHKLSEEATLGYEEAHRIVSRFINAKSMNEIIFTKGTTESLNLLAYSLSNELKEGDEILLTQMEHHSNLVPWINLAKKLKLKLNYIKVKDGVLDLEDIPISDKTKIVSVVHCSNVLGTINDVKKIGELAHKHNAKFIVDAAQSVPHMKVDVQDIDCDFLCFSGHKMLGPTGIGVLYGKEKLLEEMEPFLFGGDMISEVTFDNATWNELPWKFEAGTPNISGGIALGETVKYLEKIGMENIQKHVNELTKYALEKLKEVNLKIYGPEERGPVISFDLGVHPHDVAAILDQKGIAIRGGHMCAMPLMKLLGVDGLSRVAFQIYNTKEDVDETVEGLKHVLKVFKK